MKKILSEENIFLNLESVSKEDAIKMAGQKLVENGYVNESYIDAMIEREKIMTTYLGMGFAIPHGVNDAKKEIKNTGIVILQYPNGIEFEDGIAYIIIGIAGIGDEHLDILSKISILIDDELCERLKTEQDRSEFIKLFA